MAKYEESLSTIEDFGKQWHLFPDNNGYYCSLEMLQGMLEPLISLDKLKDKWIADVGAGTGRYTLLFQQAGACKILSLEPSSAFEILKKNTSEMDNVQCEQTIAENIPNWGFDFVFCIGVLQFIYEPCSALRAMGRALGPGGRLFLWVYAKENNRGYLLLLSLFRWISGKISYNTLKKLCFILEVPTRPYIFLCRYLKLPLSEYMINYYSKMDSEKRRLIIFDQLNPRIVKYYTKQELKALLENCGFKNIQMHNRYGYSWSVLAEYSDV